MLASPISPIEGLEEGEAEHCQLAISSLTGDRFELLGLLGRGGSSLVLLAHDRQRGLRVALKFLDTSLSKSIEDRERFRREALISARLQHAHIVPCQDFIHRGNFALAVMRYVPGHSLADRLHGGCRLSPSETRSLLVPVADALAHTHERGVVHRDVKPANILIQDEDGWPFLTDFGIATLYTSEQSRSEVAKRFGTPAFMSPEQALGEWDADHRTDIYSLGVVGFLALTGRLPFEADTAIAQAALRIAREAPSVRSVAPEVPEDVALVIDRCLARSPNRRWKSARAFGQALARTGGPHGRRSASIPRLWNRLLNWLDPRLPSTALRASR